MSRAGKIVAEDYPAMRGVRSACSWRRINCGLSLAIVFYTALGAVAFAAPPQLKQWFPPGGQVGTNVEINAKGSFSHWPARVWVDRAGLDIKPQLEKGKFLAKIAAEALPGVYWVRLYDAEGTTPPLPWIVGRLPEVAEAEPNDQPQKPQELSASSVVVNGQLAKRGDVDTFAVKLTRGQTLVAEIEAHRNLETQLDSSLEVVSPQGFVLARNDDDQGLDPRVVFVSPADGVYLVRTYGFPALPDSSIGLVGGENMIYRLTLATTAFADYSWPLAISRPGDAVEVVGWNIPPELKSLMPSMETASQTAVLDSALLANRLSLPIAVHSSMIASAEANSDAAQLVELPVTISGRIEAPRAKQRFRFQAAAGTTLSIKVESRTLGFPLDPVLELFDATGKSLSRVDDAGGDRDAELDFAIPSAGEYTLAVSDLHRQGGPRYVYRLKIAPAVPDFVLTVANDSFSVAAGGQLELPVKIERRHGFNQPVAIRVNGLADPATADPVISPIEGDLSKEVKLILKPGGKTFSGPIRISGIVGDAAESERTAVAPIAGRVAKINQLWLTVTPPAADPKQPSAAAKPAG